MTAAGDYSDLKLTYLTLTLRWARECCSPKQTNLV